MVCVAEEFSFAALRGGGGCPWGWGGGGGYGRCVGIKIFPYKISLGQCSSWFVVEMKHDSSECVLWLLSGFC